MAQLFEEFADTIKGTLKIENLAIKSGKPEVHEKIVEITPDMAKIGPKFKGDAGKIVGYLKSTPIEELESSIMENGEIAIGELVVEEDMLNIKKEIVGTSGKKVDILQAEELGVILEVIR